jgi:Spy/CpxP family protein refolding chaperone
MKNTFLILGTVGLVILGAVFAFGASRSQSGWCSFGGDGFSPVHWGRHHDAQYRMDLIAEVLDLNETQKEKLVGVHDSMKEARQAFSQIRLESMDEVLDLISSETLDQVRVQQLVQRHQSLVDEYSPSVIAALADFHTVLTPEQKSKASQFLSKWKDRLEHWKQHQT